MQRLAAGLLIVALLGLGWVVRQRAASGRPGVGDVGVPAVDRAIEPRVLPYDFGTVLSGAEVRHTFHVPNGGPATVAVLSVKAACSCTTLGESPKAVPPSGIDVPVKMHTVGMFGEVVRTVLIELEGRVPVQLEFRGRVVESCPLSVQFGRIRRGERASRTFFVRTSPEDHATVIGEEFDGALLGVRRRAVDATTTEVTVETSAAIADGPFDFPLTLLLSGPRGARHRTRVQGHVLRRVEVDNDRLLLAPAERSGDLAGKVEIYSPYGDAVSIRSVRCTDPGNLSASAGKAPGRDRREIDIAYRVSRAQRDDGFLNGTVTIEAEAGGTSSTLEVLVFGLPGGPGTPASSGEGEGRERAPASGGDRPSTR